MDPTTDFLHRIVAFALAEDVGDGDITANATVPEDRVGKAYLITRADGILSGSELVSAVFAEVDSKLECKWNAEDGQRVKANETLAVVSGPLRGLLTGERVALNFLSHLSGIATLTRKYVEAVGGHQAKILDTRKTTPGLRHLEKYAVRCGGGENHRFGLYDMILIKENHIQAAGGIETAVLAARQAASERNPQPALEVETQSVADAVLATKLLVDRVMLDNMKVADMHEAVMKIRAMSTETGKFVAVEASGNVTLDNVFAIAETGVDYISVGALTHSAPALNLSLLIS